MLAIFWKKIAFHFFCKNSTFTQSNSTRAVLAVFQFFVAYKVAINENVKVKHHESEIRLPDCSKTAINRENNDDIIWLHKETSPSIFFGVVVFLLSSLVFGSRFMSISWLVLELWHFLTRDWAEIQKSEMPLSEFCPISGDWGELGIQNLARLHLMKRYSMLRMPGA